MKRVSVASSLGILLCIAAVTARQAVTLETLLSVPFPSEIVAAPQGGRVAWVENARGARNIWIAMPPDFAARQLTAYSGDDGQDITSLVWSPDGRTLLYIRGGGPNRARSPIRRCRRNRPSRRSGRSTPRQRLRRRPAESGREVDQPSRRRATSPISYAARCGPAT